MFQHYVIETLGRGAVPEALRTTHVDEVEPAMNRVAEAMGLAPVAITAVTSVIGGSCVPCIEYVGYQGDEPVLVARPEL